MIELIVFLIGMPLAGLGLYTLGLWIMVEGESK